MGRRGGRGRDEEVVSITTAPATKQSDIDHRERRYVISMAIRTVCFVGAMLAGLVFDQTWLMWVLLVASLFLPYVAVVMANSASPRIEGTLPGVRHDELSSGPLDRGDRDR